MQKLVPFQVGHVRKGPVARLANVSFLAFLVMSRLVIFENLERGEPLLTQFALEILVVVTHVRLVQMFLDKALLTLLAIEEFYLLVRVVPFDVIYEQHVASEWGQAKPTEVVRCTRLRQTTNLQLTRSLTMIADLVPPEQRGGREPLFAPITSVRSLTRVKSQMILIHG